LIYDAAMQIVKTVGKGLIHINTADSTQPSRSTLDCSKALANFGFKPKVDLDAGLQNYWNWLIATGRTTNVRQH
jgi:nucleoside-diphosphate-sugar epimerase